MMSIKFQPKTLAVATAVALGFGISGVAFAEDTVVTAPAPGELVYDNWIELAGNGDPTVEESMVFWAVRKGANEACEGGDTVAGNVGGFGDESVWMEGDFAAEVDALGWDAGKYCFALNVGGQNRDFVDFYLVDSYAKISGVVDVPGLSGRGNGTHAFDGEVGDAGEGGLVGSISINYRYLRTECTYSPGTDATLEIEEGVATLGGQWNIEPVDAGCPALTDDDPFTLTGRGDERPRNYRGSVEGPESIGLDGGHDLKTGNVHVRERPQEEPNAE